MKIENKKRLHDALLLAHELIRSYKKVGHLLEELDEDDEEGLQEFYKACDRAGKLILTLSNKYK